MYACEGCRFRLNLESVLLPFAFAFFSVARGLNALTQQDGELGGTWTCRVRKPQKSSFPPLPGWAVLALLCGRGTLRALDLNPLGTNCMSRDQGYGWASSCLWGKAPTGQAAGTVGPPASAAPTRTSASAQRSWMHPFCAL